MDFQNIILDENNKYGKCYKRFYEEFVKKRIKKFLKEEYDKEKYPYYEYFYYSDYPDENYIEDILEHKNKNAYPLLIKYLESKKTRRKKENELYSINDLITFNKVLNLFNEQYSQKIPREKAESKKIIDIDIYQQNRDLINKFIEIFNKYGFSKYYLR